MFDNYFEFQINQIYYLTFLDGDPTKEIYLKSIYGAGGRICFLVSFT